MSEWNEFLFEFGANLALLVSLTFIYGLFLRKLRNFGENKRAIAEGLLFGVIAVIGMQIPLHIASGIIIDGRTVIVMLAGAFGGPFAGVVSAVVVATYRFYLGGVGTLAGIGAISTAAVVGVFFWYRLSLRASKIKTRHLLLMSIPMTIISLLWVFALPATIDPITILRHISLPVGIMYPLATLILGNLLAQELRRLALLGRLRESEKRVRQFADVASDWFWEMDEDLRFTYFSERVEEVVGVTAAFHIGKTREDLAGEDATTEKWQNHFRDLRDHKPFRDFRYDRKGPDGKLQYLSSSGLPVFDERGKFSGYIGIGSDLTFQIEVEEQVVKANERLAAAVESLVEPFALWDAEDHLVIGNQAFRQINAPLGPLTKPGVTYEEFARALIQHDLIPEARGREDEWLKDRLHQHRNPMGPFEQLRPNGKWLILNEQLLPDGGTATISTDITRIKSTELRLKMSQGRFSDFASAAADWYWEQDSELRFTDVSQDNATITGMSVSDHIGKTRRETEILGVTEEELCAHEAVLDAREPFSKFRFWRTRPDGKKVHISISGKPYYNADGTFAGYRGAGQDISELVEMNEQLRSAQRMEAVGQLTGGIAHDFNNLMAVMVGNAELLEHNIESGDNFSVNIAAIKKAALNGASLTHRLLAFSRQQPLSPVASDVGDLIDGLAEMFRRTLGADIDLSVETDPDLWQASIDPHQFEDALLNLAINAKHAMPSGGHLVIASKNVVIDDEMAAESEGLVSGEYVDVSIQDTGTGISGDLLDKIFEPFFTTKDVGDGSGLGLSMVYGFARQSKGAITVDSEPGSGTTFHLYLPRSVGNPAGTS
jgi:PAS domain S-box-containing protein